MESDSYNGLVVSIAQQAWRQWGQALGGHGISKDDVVQQGQLLLLELLPRIDAQRPKGEQAGYVYRSLRWAIRGWILERCQDRIARTRGVIAPIGQADHVANVEPIASDEPTDKAGLLDLKAALELLDPITRRILLLHADGHKVSAIARETGLKPDSVKWRITHGTAIIRERMTQLC